MREDLRNAAALGLAGLCLVLGFYSWLHQAPPSSGVTLRLDGSTIVVDSIDPAASDAIGELRPGMVVMEIDGNPVDGVKRADLIEAGLRGDFGEIGVADPTYVGPRPYNLATLPEHPIGFTLLVGVGLMAGIAAWVGRGRAGEALRPLAIPLAAAVAAPLLIVPGWAPLNTFVLVSAIGLPALARLVLADGFIEEIPRGFARLAALTGALIATVACVLIDVVYFGLTRDGLNLSQVVIPASVVPAAATTLIPVSILLWSRERGDRVASATVRGPSEDRIPLLLAAVTPTVIAFGYLPFNLGVSFPLLWLLVVVMVLQTNARVETLRIQRDTVVAATEIERARLAADLHDDALQEMTVLVRRLDEGGDARAAELARSIADRLREVCGELHLPILDELGAGPALEWLVERVGETSGREVFLERADAARPPADVELAVFRVAQEALANAVNHGAPPITVRYDAAVNRASLSITDHGEGLNADAAAMAGRSGHYGLLNMRQRAEQIGGRLDFRRPPEGGTVIGLIWTPA